MPLLYRALSLTLIVTSLLMVAPTRSALAAEICFAVPSNATASLTTQYQEIVSDFNKENPNDLVNLMPRSSYNQVLDLALQRDVKGVFAAEIAELYTLQEAGAIDPIGALNASDAKMNRFLEGFMPGFLDNSRNSSGALMALPLYRSTPIIYYNLDMLRKANIETEKLPKTWAELTEILVKLRDFYGSPPLALPGVWREWIFESFVHQNGGSLSGSKNQLNFDDPSTISALELWAEWNRRGLVLLLDNWKDGINGYVRGSFPVVYYSTAGMATAKKYASFNWMVDVMPGNPKPGAVVGGANLFLSSNMDSEQKSLAKRLLLHLLSPENQAKISAASGYFPVVDAAFDLPVLSQIYEQEPAFANARRQLTYAHARIMTLKHNAIRKLLQRAIEETLSGQSTAGQALAQTQINATGRISWK